MASPTPAMIKDTGKGLIYDVVSLALQAFFFGLYTVVTALATRMLLKRGLKTRSQHALFFLTIITYLLSTAYWAYSVADVVDRMRVFINDVQNPSNYNASHDEVTKWSPLFNALVLVNYIFSDAVVVWRAWIICLRSYRKYLWFTIAFLVLTAISIICIIIFRIIALVEVPYAQLPNGSYLRKGIDILQISAIGCSLISNLSATVVVGATAWEYRRSIRAAFADNTKSTTANQILMLVVESGLLYCISGLTVLISSLIRLPHGTLGDIYTPINVQIAAAYPPVVLLLISTQRPLNETTFLGTFQGSTRSGPLQFDSSRANSGEQTGAPTISLHFARNPDLSRTELGSEGEVLNSGIEMMSVYGNPPKT
ncbi:hypothetical protein B0H19DRAFT_54622 [Mycena capillaripes]|nr:hypothetical protein B0H19DRAFT_54622 [Mycena capillaripes]